MNPKVKKKWLAALTRPDTEPGWYKKAKHRLVQTDDGVDSFCCLGVLNNLAIEEGILDPGYWNDEHRTWKTCTIPIVVQEWAGINPETCRSLATINDHSGDTFEEVVEHIKTNL